MSFVGKDNSLKLGLNECEPEIEFTNPTAATSQGRKKHVMKVM